MKINHGSLYRNEGFTLIEILVVLVIASIIGSIAVPSFKTFIQNNRMSGQANGLLGFLNAARAEAITQRRTISVCPSANGTSCDNTALDKRWIYFIDIDSDGVVDADDTVVRQYNTPESGIVISRLGVEKIQFNSQGNMVNSGSGSIKLCDPRGANYAKAVVISAIGRVSISTDSNSPADGIGNDHAGDNLTCP